MLYKAVEKLSLTAVTNSGGAEVFTPEQTRVHIGSDSLRQPPFSLMATIPQVGQTLHL